MFMKFFRKKKNMKIILWVVAILIIPGFIIWGVGIGGGDKGQYYVATVNREHITLREYYMELGRVEEEYRRIFGDKASELFKGLNIEQGILESMIREKLLLQEARKRRIRVLNNEIVEVVKSDPAFQDEKGRFDERRYREVISSYPPEELRKIEDELRKRIMIEKLKEMVVAEGNVSVSDEEVERYIKENQIKDVDRESIKRRLLWQARENYFNQWYANKRKSSKVEIYLSFEQPSAPGNSR
ncbi:MAG: SurA N-terminal domain-containing protein [Candidatus Ratteibacteria bacterium]|nr:SurA N-terminal domain-containing protein [Candidatus Ratteibacteria bacterium]